MGMAKQRRINARANRQASRNARYSTGSIYLPQPKVLSKKGLVEVAKIAPTAAGFKGSLDTSELAAEKQPTGISNTTAGATKGERHG